MQCEKCYKDQSGGHQGACVPHSRKSETALKKERWRFMETKKGTVASSLALWYLFRIKWVWGPWGYFGTMLWGTSLTKGPTPKNNRQPSEPSFQHGPYTSEQEAYEVQAPGREPLKFWAAHNFLDPSGSWEVGGKTLHTHWNRIFLDPSENRTEHQLPFNF